MSRHSELLLQICFILIIITLTTVSVIYLHGIYRVGMICFVLLILGVWCAIWLTKTNKDTTTMEAAAARLELSTSYLIQHRQIENAETTEAFSRLGIEFISRDFIIILVDKKPTGSVPVSVNPACVDIRKTIRENFIRCSIPGRDRFFHLYDNRFFCLIVNPIDPDMKYIDSLKTRISSAMNQTANELKCSFFVYIGRVAQGYGTLFEAYTEATSALGYFRQSERQNLLLTHEEVTIEPIDALTLQNRVRGEKEYLNYIYGNDYAAAGKVLEQLVDIEQNYMPRVLQNFRLQIFGRIEMAVNCLEVDTDQISEEAELIRRQKAKMESTRSIDEIKGESKALFVMLDDYYEKYRRKSDLRLTKVLEYMHVNFTSPELNVSQICEKNNISPSFLTKTFKKKMGCNVLEYIHKLKVDRVKYLLERTDDSIDAISVKTGFSGRHALNRIFKKQEGITPGSYRELSRNSETVLCIVDTEDELTF